MTAPAPSRISSAAMSREATTVRIAAALKPDPDAEREAYVAGALARPTREARGLAKFALIDDADIRREFSAEFVAQAQAGIDVRKAGADQARRVRLTVEVHFDLRLQDQPLREQQVVGGLELGRQMALAAHETGYFQIEEVRGKTLDAQSGPIARGP